MTNQAYIKAQTTTYNSFGLEAAQGGQLTDAVLYRASLLDKQPLMVF